MVNTTDKCTFNIEVKITQAIRQHRILYAATMPRYLEIEMFGYHVRLLENMRATVGGEEVDLSEGPYEDPDGQFTIHRQFHQVDRLKRELPTKVKHDYIIFESTMC